MTSKSWSGFPTKWLLVKVLITQEPFKDHLNTCKHLTDPREWPEWKQTVTYFVLVRMYMYCSSIALTIKWCMVKSLCKYTCTYICMNLLANLVIHEVIMSDHVILQYI